MKTKILKFWYKNPWYKPGDDNQHYREKLEVPEDIVFCKLGFQDVMFVYPYSLEVWRLLEEQNHCRTKIYNVNNEWIIGIIGDGFNIHYETEMTFVEHYDMFDNSDYCIRQDREIYDDDVVENKEIHSLLHSELSVEDRIDKLRELGFPEIKTRTEFCDIRIIGLKYGSFKIIRNLYAPIFPTGNREYRSVEVDYINIVDFFSEFSWGASPHILNHWISIDDFQERLDKTISEIQR